MGKMEQTAGPAESCYAVSHRLGWMGLGWE